MQSRFAAHSAELHRASKDLTAFHQQVALLVDTIRKTVAHGGKLLIAGNGGSAAQAQHLSDELVGRYDRDRAPLPAIALTADGPVLTCIANDYGYHEIFRRQVRALGAPGDLLICLSTSGSSENLLLAAREARQRGVTVAALIGRDGPLSELADLVVNAPSDRRPIVQELHLHAIHLLCEALESGIAASETSRSS